MGGGEGYLIYLYWLSEEENYYILSSLPPFLPPSSLPSLSLPLPPSPSLPLPPSLSLPSYTLVVVARDRGAEPRSSNTTVLVTVEDENDNTPVIENIDSGVTTQEVVEVRST